MYTIATLYQIRQRLGLSTTDTADDNKLLVALQSASALIERLTNRRFCPRIATVEHHANPFDATELLLDDDLLELATLTNGDGSIIPGSNIIAIPDSGGNSPISILKLVNGAAFVWNATPIHAIQVAGTWGWHNRWSQAWLGSADTVQNNPLSSSATSLTVADADGADAENESPRFQVGQLIRIESEYLRLLAVNTTSNVLSVQRGVGGTTAAAHNQNTAIQVYQPPLDVATVALRWAVWLYKEPDNRTFSPAPATLVKELEDLRRVRVKA